MRKIAITVILLLLPSSATRADDTINTFTEEVQHSVRACRGVAYGVMLQRETRKLRAQLGEKVPDEIDENHAQEFCSEKKQALLSKYKEASPLFRQKKELSEAIKTYFAYAVSLLDNAPPLPGENKRVYENRIIDGDQKLSELLNRVKIEDM